MAAVESCSIYGAAAVVAVRADLEVYYMDHLISLDRVQCFLLEHWKRLDWAAGKRMAAVAGWLKL